MRNQMIFSDNSKSYWSESPHSISITKYVGSRDRKENQKRELCICFRYVVIYKIYFIPAQSIPAHLLNFYSEFTYSRQSYNVKRQIPRVDARAL